MHHKGQRFDVLGESLHCFRKLSVLSEHLHKEGRLVCRKRRAFLARAVQILTMFCVGERVSGVAVSLACLS